MTTLAESQTEKGIALKGDWRPGTAWHCILSPSPLRPTKKWRGKRAQSGKKNEKKEKTRAGKKVQKVGRKTLRKKS